MRFFLNLLLAMLIFGCVTDDRESSVPNSAEDYPDQESWNATILITKEAHTVGHLKAGKIEKYSKKNITLLKENIKIDFYNNEGRHTSMLTSEGGKVFDNNQDMLAYGNVVVISDSGMTLYTDTLKWDNKKQKIISEVPIMITTEEGDTLYGDSFISDPNLRNREIINPHGKSVKSINID
ncbi:MAG: LPS export ABC transporter periplasmic protein LptC [Calditrichaceae bacterium]|nr:LPS export ABC transporter periplasmic protein LptC [Calditrichaceae bacterium]